jgi:hypothetical protein
MAPPAIAKELGESAKARQAAENNNHRAALRFARSNNCYILIAATMDARLGDVIDDFCVKCRRLTNHSVVSLLNGAAAKVRCRTCYSDHDYRNEQAPPSKKDLKKAELFNAVLSGVAPPPAAPEEPGEEGPKKSAKKPGKRAEA